MNLSLEDRVARLEKEIETLKARSNGAAKTCHSIADLAGIGAHDPLFEQWINEIAERRREIDADPSAP